MYLRHFNLDKKPFQISSDPSFLWQGPWHKKALSSLKTGIRKHVPLMVLTGDVGTGKTTLINDIIHTLPDGIHHHRINDPYLEINYLFYTIAQTFGFKDSYKQGVPFSKAFFDFLKDAKKKGTPVLVIVDEAQRIPKRFFKELLRWAQFDLNPVLTILLAGQLELIDVLSKTLGPDWERHVGVHGVLKPLDENQTGEYIQRRLEIAGTTSPLFEHKAIHEIYDYTKGFPRLINIACDHALITAYGKDFDRVDVTTFKEGIDQLELPAVPQPEQQKPKKETERSVRINTGFRNWPGRLGTAIAMVGIGTGIIFYTGQQTSNIEHKQNLSEPLIAEGYSAPEPGEFNTETEQTVIPSKTFVPLETIPDETIEKEEAATEYQAQLVIETDDLPTPVSDTNDIAPEQTELQTTESVIEDETAVAQPMDVDQFVNEVFLIDKEKDEPVTHLVKSAPPAVSSTQDDEIDKKDSPLHNESTDTPNRSQGQEPDAGAIIDW
ncbi:MAG: AAA family ATPase, partial [Desulfobacterales bacterium]|nr:AAA family ATPase [Desulfobacterales bacterium]